MTGLTGSQTTDTNSLKMEIDNNAAATAKWIQSNGTLTVVLSGAYTETENGLKIVATLQEPSEAQETRTPSFSIYRDQTNSPRQWIVNSTILDRPNQGKILYSPVSASKRRMVESGTTTRKITIELNVNTKMNVETTLRLMVCLALRNRAQTACS